MPYRWICALTMSLSLTAGVEPVESVIVDTDTPRPDYGYPLDQTLRVNHIQAKGTHNSYHLRSPEPADPSHDYDQPSLTDQLELYGIRQVELDVHYIADEGYSRPVDYYGIGGRFEGGYFGLQGYTYLEEISEE